MNRRMLLKGSAIAMLGAMNKMAMAPNHKAVDVLKPNEPAFGNKAMTTMATKAPKIKYGKRRPILGNQVRSEK